MPAQKKLLLIAYFFPPFNTVGAIRAAKFAKYLPEYGWEPIVLTRDWHSATGLPPVSGVQTIHTGYKDRLAAFRHETEMHPHTTAQETTAHVKPTLATSGSRKSHLRHMASYWAKEFLAYPDEFTGWKGYALEAGRRIIREQGIDLIFCTGKPFSSFAIARQLALESGLPWVADFRDPWTQGPAYNHNQVRAFLEQGLERHTLRSARLLTTVSTPWADGLQRLHHKPVTVIANGYDEEDYAGPPPVPTARFTLTYTGQIYAGTHNNPGYSGERDLSPLFEGVRHLLDRGVIDPARFEIRFYGPERDQPVVLSEAQSYGVESVVNHYGLLPYTTSLFRQRESTALLLLNWKSAQNTFRQQGWFTAKVYEYMGAQRPILAVPAHAGIETLLQETGSGQSVDTAEEVAALLEDWYAQFQATGRLAYQGDPDAIRSYTRRGQTEKLATVFNQLVPRTSHQTPVVLRHRARFT